MKLVIDIPQKNFIKDDFIRFFGCYNQKLDEMIKNGIPLPKGHGALKDVDALYEDLMFPNEQFSKAFKDILDDAPTIIKADK